MSICMSVCPQKVSSISVKFGSGMQYHLIQGQGLEPLKVGKSAIFKGYLLPIYNGGWQMTMDS